MSLGRHDNESTWGAAMTAHGQLESVTKGYLTNLALYPLGKKSVIKGFIEREIKNVENLTPGGVLPQVVMISVAGSGGGGEDFEIAVPASLGARTIMTLQSACRQGFATLETAIAALDDTSYADELRDHEEEFRASFSRSHDGTEPTSRQIREENARWNRERGVTEPRGRRIDATLQNLLRQENGGTSVSERDIESAAAAVRTATGNSTTQPTALTSVQQYAALATVMASCAETCVAAASVEGAGSEALNTARQTIGVIGTVCSTVAGVTASSVIVSTIFAILAVVCGLINWILDAIREYTTPTSEGWRAEWDETISGIILRDRLRILVQIDEKYIDPNTPDGWAASWTAVMAAHPDWRAFDVLKDFINKTAGARGEERVTNARAIAQILGGRDAIRGLLMCEDIKNWLLYIGMDETLVDSIYTWLYEARKVSIVKNRRGRLLEIRNNDSFWRKEYAGNMVAYTGRRSTDHCKTKHPCSYDEGDVECRYSMEAGSDFWYSKCCGLNTGDSSKFQYFRLSDLGDVHGWLRSRLRVVEIILPSWQHVPQVTQGYLFDPDRLWGRDIRDWLLTGTRYNALLKEIVPSGTSEQLARIKIADFWQLYNPGISTDGKGCRGVFVIPGIPESMIDPVVVANSKRITVGGETVFLWHATNWFMLGSLGGYFYPRKLPVDPHYNAAKQNDPVLGTIASSETTVANFWRKRVSGRFVNLTDDEIRAWLWQQCALGTPPSGGNDVGNDGRGGGSGSGLIVGAGVAAAAAVAAAFIIKR